MASATADFLIAQAWSQIAGNHDRNLATSDPAGLGPSDACAYAELGQEALAWVAQLPPSVILHGRVLLIHGTPARDTECLLETVVRGVPRLAAPTEDTRYRLGNVKTEVVLCGHSHIPRSVRTPSGLLIVNPGSVGLQAYEHDDPEYHVMATGSPDPRYAVIEKTRRQLVGSAGQRSVPDTELVVELANRNGRPDWVTALATGTFSPASSLLQPFQVAPTKLDGRPPPPACSNPDPPGGG